MLKTNDMKADDTLYGYTPTFSVCATFIVLFAISARMFRQCLSVVLSLTLRDDKSDTRMRSRRLQAVRFPRAEHTRVCNGGRWLDGSRALILRAR